MVDGTEQIRAIPNAPEMLRWKNSKVQINYLKAHHRIKVFQGFKIGPVNRNSFESREFDDKINAKI